VAVKIEDIQELIGLQLGRTQVRTDDLLIEDLGAESVDLVNIVASAEDKYSIFIEEEEIPKIRTAADLFSMIRKKF
jgi:acyl carrier protein